MEAGAKDAMKKEPIRHHYIPRFILRKFCDENGELSYFDLKTRSVSLKKPEDVFVTRNLYRDIINHPEDPVKIETDLAKFENETREPGIEDLKTKKVYNYDINES